VGHGHRTRVVWGPAELNGPPEVRTVQQRRYRCRACGTVVVVRPREVIGSLRYGATAVALSMYLWSRERLAGHKIREQVSPLPGGLYQQLHGWRQLGRWARAAHRLWRGVQDVAGTAREKAFGIVSQIAAHTVHVTAVLAAQLWDGAQRA